VKENIKKLEVNISKKYLNYREDTKKTYLPNSQMNFSTNKKS